MNDSHEIHIFPSFEDPEKHWKNPDCWCEPELKTSEEHYDFEKEIDDCFIEHEIYIHKAVH